MLRSVSAPTFGEHLLAIPQGGPDEVFERPSLNRRDGEMVIVPILDSRRALERCAARIGTNGPMLWLDAQRDSDIFMES